MLLTWLLSILGVLLAIPLVIAYAAHRYIFHNYIPHALRIFGERPLFIIPRGVPVPEAEEVTLTTVDGVTLRGCYFKALPPRKGVLLFGLEFGSNRWSCEPYTDFLRDAGYDIFAFEMRGQGDSPAQPGYESLQWVTDFEVLDFEAALAYLKSRHDRDPRGIGFFGLSKGGSAGLIAAAKDEFVRCIVTDGIFSTSGTMIPYMKQWIKIYARSSWRVALVPYFYYGIAARHAIRLASAARRCSYPSLEAAMPALAPRPLLMIHGGADSYIKPDMAKALFKLAGEPKELWLVEKAKHNQSIQLANGTYKARVRDFFDKHLAQETAPAVAAPSLNGSAPHAPVASIHHRPLAGDKGS